MSVPVIDQVPALSGPKAHVYHRIAEEFLTSSTGKVKIEDFGSPQERLLVSPVVAYLARRGSESIRLELGISRRENGQVKGAILRYAVGRYEYQPDLVWPQKGEVDPGLRRAEEHAIRRQAKKVQAQQRTRSETPAKPPVSVAEPVEPPPPASPPVPPQVTTRSASEPTVAAATDLDTVQILTQTKDLIVLRNGNDLVVAAIKSVTSL